MMAIRVSTVVRSVSRQSCVLGAIFLVAGCSSDGVPGLGDGTGRGGATADSTAKSAGGSDNKGGSSNTEQNSGTGGTTATTTTGAGGSSKTGGSDASGGRSNTTNSGSNVSVTGGHNGEGGSSVTAKGGATQGSNNTGKGGSTGSSGGTTNTAGGGLARGGNPGSGGVNVGFGGRSPGAAGNNQRTGGTTAAGGAASGGKPTAGGPATGGGTSTSSSTSTTAVDCNATMPTGGTQHSGNMQGGSGNLAWQIWSNVGSGTLTTFSTPAFSAAWNNSGDYLGRMGFEWGNGSKTYDAYGTITAQFAYKKTGTGGGYSYIGIYGWSVNPCVEYYIVDDSFNTMPVNPGSTTNKGTVDLDGGTYIMYTRSTSGTGGSRCSGVSNWMQYYSIRKTGRQCGEISVTKHFDAWKAAGMSLGNMLEAKILVEVGGGSGSVDFPVANMTASQ
jgi:endo-1,4-beta-xylanase